MTILWQAQRKGVRQINCPMNGVCQSLLLYLSRKLSKHYKQNSQNRNSKLIPGLCFSRGTCKRSLLRKVLHHLTFNLKLFIFKSATIRCYYQPFIMKCRIHFPQRRKNSALNRESQGKPPQLRSDVLKITVLYLSPHEARKLYCDITALSLVPYKSGTMLAKF